jgi:Peptidase family C54
VLGVERLNTVYAEQLRRVLSWPQSAGIVGGKPGHSYYFLGYQARATHVSNDASNMGASSGAARLQRLTDCSAGHGRKVELQCVHAYHYASQG